MSLPALNYLSNASRTEGEQKVAFEDLNKGIKQVPGAGVADQALTIASGSVTPASGASAILVLDTEASGATDDLTNIVVTNIDDGAMVWLRNANAARVVVVKHSAGGSGQISLATGGDCVLADPDRHWLLLKRNGTLFLEVARFPSADLFPMLSKSGNYTTTTADRGRLIDCTATLTLTLLPAATAGKGFEQIVQCSGGVTTIDPNGAETIGGASTMLLYRGDKIRFVSDGTNWQVIDRHNAQIALDKWIQGLTYSPNGTDAANDIDFSAGSAMDSTGVYLLRGTAMTKQIDTAFAVGNNQGMLSSAAPIGNGDWYLWLIGRSDTGATDYLTDPSNISPAMPPNYDFKRLIGWMERKAGANSAIATKEIEGGGVELFWKSPTLDIDLANTLTTSRRTDVIRVPKNFSVEALLNVFLTDATASANAWICNPDHDDLAPSGTVAPLANVLHFTTAGFASDMRVRTSSTGTIAARSTLATVDTYRVVTVSFKWSRRD